VISYNYKCGSTVLVGIDVVSVMTAHSDLLCVCVVCGAGGHYRPYTICRQNTDNARIDKHSGTIPVILAKH